MMRLQIAKSWDFNQMLVASVFGHLFFMTFVLFLPKTTVFEEIIPPAFMVELVEISQGQKKAGQKPLPLAKTVKTVTPITPTNLIDPIRQSVKMPSISKTQDVNRKASDQIINSLDQLNNSPAKLFKELDQLARLKPIESLKKPVIKKSKPFQEKTFDEMNALKNKKVEVLPNKAKPLPVENPLDQFDSLKMEDTLDVDPLPIEPVAEKKTGSRLKELEFASLSKYTVKLKKKQDEKSSADLLKELTEMKQPSNANKERIVAPSQEIQPLAKIQTKEKSQAFDSILKKLDSLDTKAKNIDTHIVVPETLVQNFQSDIRKVSAPKQVQVDVVISANQAYVQSPIPGKPGADALSLYKGMIIQKVMENWHAPLGQDYNKMVVISFNIYSQGNIDRPDLKESSHVELLDSLAMRAIRESEPFPKFPESLKSSNLNISIHFKYIPEKTKHDS